LWGIFCLQNPTVRAGFRSWNPTIRVGSASQLKRGTVVGRTDKRTHTTVVIIYKIFVILVVYICLDTPKFDPDNLKMDYFLKVSETQ
jgi:hypothetical protein